MGTTAILIRQRVKTQLLRQRCFLKASRIRTSDKHIRTTYCFTQPEFSGNLLLTHLPQTRLIMRSIVSGCTVAKNQLHTTTYIRIQN